MRAELPAQVAEHSQPQTQQPQRATDAELRADGLLMLAAAMAPFLMDVEPAAAGNPLLTGKTVSDCALASCCHIAAWSSCHGDPISASSCYAVHICTMKLGSKSTVIRSDMRQKR